MYLHHPQVNHFNGRTLIQTVMTCLLEQRRICRMWMESLQPTLGDIIQSITGGETEESIGLVLGRTNNGQSLGQHHLVRAVRVQVHAGQECRLSGMRLK